MERVTTTEHGADPNPLDTTGLCLLSLDGGGVRGLSTLYILKIIIDRLNHERKATALPPVKPCEIFDLIGGTSTGGLIAIMLGRLEMEVDECITAYSELAAAVFGEKLSRIPFNIIGRVQARFDLAKLESAIRRVIRQSGVSETDLLNDGAERGCRTFVCTADRNTKEIVCLRSYSLPDELNINATIYQAALATSAATTFFNLVSIGDRTFADGALDANNPVNEVEGEASNIWCLGTGDLKHLVKCFISIGTGNPGKKPFENSVIKFLGETVVQIATETTSTEKKFIARWTKLFDERRYFRFDVDQGLQDIGLDEYKRKGVIESATEGYLNHTVQKLQVRDCIQNLSLKQKKPDTSLNAIINEYTERTVRQHLDTNDTFWMVPFDRNNLFTGREPQLFQLKERLFIQGQTTKIAITGLGGIGKTQLVLELIYSARGWQEPYSVIWIPAMNMDSLQRAYRDVAQHLRLPGWDDDKSDMKKSVKDFLSKENIGQWILVFDNADNIDMWVKSPDSDDRSDPLIHYLPRSNRGSIIFTTRDRRMAVTLAHQNIVDVPLMSREVATRVLHNHLVNKDLLYNKQDTRELLEQLVYLPLAIVQAAEYINKNSISLADYLSFLRDEEEEVIGFLSNEFDDGERHNSVKNLVATTWLVSFEQIRCSDTIAAHFLSFIACVAPNDIPESLLPPSFSRRKHMHAIGTLEANYFITRSINLTFDIHPLVHLAARGWLRKGKMLAAWTEKAVVRLSEVFPDNGHQNRSVWRKYIAHACYALKSDLIYKYDEKRINLARKLGRCLQSDGRFNEAAIYFTEVMEARKRELGAEHPDTLTSIADLASTLREQAQWKEAERLEVEVMGKRERVLGRENPDTLTSINNLALTYKYQGRWKEAEELGVHVVETRKRVLGAEHQDTLISMANLALMYAGQGRWGEANKLDLQVVEIMERVLGAEHPDTLIIMANLALTYQNIGQWQQALELDEQVIKTMKRVLGIVHPSTLTCMGNFAVMCKDQGWLEKAITLEIEVLEMRKTLLGVKHPDTLTSMHNLAHTWKSLGEDFKALNLMEECVWLRTKILGVDHPDSVSSSEVLIKWRSKIG